MIKTFSRKLLLIFSGVLLLSYGVIQACGGGDWFEDWYYSYNSNFTPEAFVEESYSPLFLSGEIFYGIGFDDRHNSRFNDEITSDWENYLKEAMPKETVKFFLIEESAQDIIALDNYYTTQKSNQVVAKWATTVALGNERVKRFITFLALAKKTETASLRKSYWEYDSSDQKVFTDWKVIRSLEKQYATTTDDFMKNRYWFQLMKAYFYSDNKQKAIDFFDQTAQKVEKNTLYYRAFGYCAGVNYSRGNYAVSNYMYSVLFDNCPQMRVVATYSFRPNNENDWNGALALAKNNKEKAALWAIHGYYKDEQNAVSEIFKLDPGSKHLNYLLTRLINKQENKINVTAADSNDGGKKKVVKVDSEVYALVSQIAKSNQTDQPYLWKIAMGYLQVLKGEHGMADKTFKGVKSELPKTELASNQLRLLQLINNLSQVGKISSSAENALLSDLNWLYITLPNSENQKFRYYNATEWSKKYLATLYLKKKNFVMSEIFAPKEEFYDSKRNVQAMKEFILKENKSAWEVLAQKIYSTKIEDIENYEAVQATFENNISSAISHLENTTEKKNMILLANPFNGNIKDCHDCEHQAPQSRKFTALQFLKIVDEMQQKLKANEDVYNNSLLLGNAFYNISFFGNARIYHEGALVGSGSSPTNFRTQMMKMIVDCSTAKQYYKQAYEAASNKEQKAKCLYMISKCERNDYYNTNYYFQDKGWWDIYDSEVNFKAWDSFKALRKEYSDTQYYQEVINECGYFNTYTMNATK